MSEDLSIIEKREIQLWKKAGFTTPEIKKWKKQGFNLETAQIWSNNGFTLEGALVFIKEGLNPEESRNLIIQEITDHDIDSIIIKLKDGTYTKDEISELIQKEKIKTFFLDLA